MLIHLAGAESTGHMQALLDALPPGGPILQSFHARTRWEPLMTTIWTAGNLGGTLSECLVGAGHFYHLDSYASTGKKQTMIDQRFKFFLDSGAYSAWTRGAVIDLDEYCEFIKANAEHLEVYANLDCIAGTPDGMATPEQREEAAEQSWRNFLYMTEVHGLPGVMPVYHYGETVKHLQRMLDYGCSYIGLGGLVGTARRTRQQWLDRIWNQHLTNDDGTPKVKVHGFGMTTVDHIFRYPWFSVDSTSWLQSTANGMILMPQKRDGKFVFDSSPYTINVSTSNDKATEQGKHIDSMPTYMVDAVAEWLALCGKTIEQVKEHYSHRGVVNATFFRMVSESAGTTKLNKGRLSQSTLFT